MSSGLFNAGRRHVGFSVEVKIKFLKFLACNIIVKGRCGAVKALAMLVNSISQEVTIIFQLLLRN